MARGHIEFLSLTSSQPDQSYAFGDVVTGLQARLLSRDLQTGAHTAQLRARPLWRWSDAGFFNHDVEVLVLDGALRLSDAVMRGGSYTFIPAGQHVSALESPGGCSLLWMASDDSGFTKSHVSGRVQRANGAVAPVDLRSLPWTTPPDFEGRSTTDTVPGLSVKWLREDPETTAYTLLSRHAPGWADPRLEAHDTWEELLLLDGDYLMGDTGTISAGTYIFRPGQRPHGPQVTRNGAVWFCRGERRIDFQLQSPEWAIERVKAYSELHVVADTPPWGNWI